MCPFVKDPSPDPLPVSPLEPFAFDVSESLVPVRSAEASGVSAVSFDGLLKKPLLLQEDLKEGCGGKLWPAGMLLAKYLLRRQSTLAHKSMSVHSA